MGATVDSIYPCYNDGFCFLHNDHLGSASVMSTSAGAPVADTTGRYLPFGDWRTEPTANLTDRGYTSHKHNNMGSDDIGLIYMNARYYVPGVGRFASADSIVPNPANPQSYNRYSYVRNNPLNLVDPTGHCGADDDELLTEQCEELRDELTETYGIGIEEEWTYEEMVWLSEAIIIFLEWLGEDALPDSLKGIRLIRSDLKTEVSGWYGPLGNMEAIFGLEPREGWITLALPLESGGSAREILMHVIVHELVHPLVEDNPRIMELFVEYSGWEQDGDEWVAPESATGYGIKKMSPEEDLADLIATALLVHSADRKFFQSETWDWIYDFPNNF